MVRLTIGRRTQTICASRGDAGRAGSAGRPPRCSLHATAQASAGASAQLLPAPCGLALGSFLRLEFLAGVMAAAALVLGYAKMVPVLDYLGKPA
jgi:hypothetical protein